MPSDTEINALIERLTEAANLRPPLLASPMLEKAAHFLAALRDERISFSGVAKRKLDDLTSDQRGWKICGYAIEKDGKYGLVTTGAFVGWWSVAEENANAAEARVRELEQKLERARVALEEMLFDYGDKYDGECRLKNFNELEMIDRARAALAEIGQRG